MSTSVVDTTPATREQLLQHGVFDRIGAITFFNKAKGFGAITIDFDEPLEFFFHRKMFPASERENIRLNAFVVFSAPAGQLRDDCERRPRVSKIQLLKQ